MSTSAQTGSEEMWRFQCGNPSARLGEPTAGRPDRKSGLSRTGEIMKPPIPCARPPMSSLSRTIRSSHSTSKTRSLSLGVSSVRCAGSVATALNLIAARVPDFALLDVGLAREKSYAVAEKLAALKDSVRVRDGLWRRQGPAGICRSAAPAEAVFERRATHRLAALRAEALSYPIFGSSVVDHGDVGAVPRHRLDD